MIGDGDRGQHERAEHGRHLSEPVSEREVDDGERRKDVEPDHQGKLGACSAAGSGSTRALTALVMGKFSSVWPVGDELVGGYRRLEAVVNVFLADEIRVDRDGGGGALARGG